MRIAAIAQALLLLVIVSGCRSRSDLVEAELRTKDRELREAQAERDRCRMVNDALEREFMQRQQGPPRNDNSSILAPKDITIGSGTGPEDDRKPGDEALRVVVVPRDEDGNPVRALGTLHVTAWEIMPGGVKAPLCDWEVNTTDLRRSWKSGLLGSGYHVTLKWKKLPTQPRLRITVQMLLPDGRVYEADKDITIRPLTTSPPPFSAPPAPEQIPPIGPEIGPARP